MLLRCELTEVKRARLDRFDELRRRQLSKTIDARARIAVRLADLIAAKLSEN